MFEILNVQFHYNGREALRTKRQQKERNLLLLDKAIVALIILQIPHFVETEG